MGRLSSDHVLKNSKASDASSVSALKLDLKALSDVSCLKGFKNLQRLDLGFNNLASLEDLRPCVGLKWLSVVQNKLRSLKGVEALSNLTVLNAGKNKLSSMDEIQSLVGLRALILNDNEITSICMLDQMKELNTLVLSRNPIRKIGKSLSKVKSLTKLSLSKCQLEAIDSSLKSCIELKELRLAHNNIKTLPAELARNTKLQNLDLGNNLIMRWSDLEVLKSLVSLRNLNLQGNPIAENEKLANKIRKALPNLQIFNAKPVNKSSRKEERTIEAIDDYSIEQNVEEVKPKDKHQSENIEKSKKGKRKRPKSEEELPKKGEPAEKEANWKSGGKVNSEMEVIDDAEAPFSDLFQAGADDDPRGGDMEEEGTTNKTLKQARSLLNESVSFPSRKKKSKKRSFDPSLLGTSTIEVGMGGQSSWDN